MLVMSPWWPCPRRIPRNESFDRYQLGQRVFGENRAQELVSKAEQLPPDIAWTRLGLQTNKVRLVAPFVSMIHSVDSLRLLEEIDKQAIRN